MATYAYLRVSTDAQDVENQKKGVSKRSIARIVECAPNTLYTWLKKKGY